MPATPASASAASALGTFEEFIRTALTHYGDSRPVSTDPHARYFGNLLEQRTLVTDDTAARRGDPLR